MRVGQIRVLGWGVMLAVAAVIMLKSGGARPMRSTASPRRPAAATARNSPPRLFQTDGHAGIKPIPLAENAAATSKKVRDSELRTAHVIREPGAPATTEPELTLAAPYQLKDRREQNVPPRQIPLDLLLNEPRREEAPVGPRVSQEVPSEPASGSPPPAPLPIMSSDNPAMQPVNEAAREHVLRGFSLGDKAAIYAARTEFIQALRTIAQALDAQAGLPPKDPQSCSLALVRGLQALNEADDFAPAGSRLDGTLDLAAIIAAHRTPACKGHKPASQLAAMQAYFDFAQVELQRAAAANSIASQALTGLGKSYTVTTEKNHGRLASAKAMVFHQAAVSADPHNHLAANELGVLLAKHGLWEPAKEAFLQSLRVHSDASAWQNLTAIHLKLGEHDLAQLADHERRLLLNLPSSGTTSTVGGAPTVQWVDPRAFAGPPEDVLPAPQPAAQDPASAAQKPGSKSWLRWK